MFCLHICMCTTCLPATHAVNKRVSSLPELKLSMVLNHHVGARNWTCVFWKSSEYTKLLSHLSIPFLCSFETRSHCIAKAQPYKCRDYNSELPQPVWMLWFKGFREIWVKLPGNLWGTICWDSSTPLASCFPDDRIVNWSQPHHSGMGQSKSTTYKLSVYIQISFSSHEKRKDKGVNSSLILFNFIVTSLWHP